MSIDDLSPRTFILISSSNNHIQDVLVVSYLANTIRTQIELSNRLATAALTLGNTGEGVEQSGNTKEGETRQRGGGQRGGRQAGVHGNHENPGNPGNRENRLRRN